MAEIRNAISIEGDDLEFTEDVMVEGQVTRVTLTRGTLTINAEESKVKNELAPYLELAIRSDQEGLHNRYVDLAVLYYELNVQERDFFEGYLSYQQYEEAAVNYYASYVESEDAYIEEIVEEELQRSLDEISDSLRQIEDEGPIDIAATRQEQLDELGYSNVELLSVVTVNEGDGWYVSPLMTGADFGFRVNHGDKDIPLGSAIPEATNFKTPEDAAAGLAEAVASGRPEDLAKVMSLPERRLVAVYGPALTQQLGRESIWKDGVHVGVSDTEFASHEESETMIVGLSYVKMTSSGRTGPKEVIIENQCVTEVSHNYDAQSRGCLGNPDDYESPWRELSQLGLSISVVAVQEDGSWLISPMHSIYYHGNTMLGNLLTLNNEDRLEELRHRY